MIVLFTVLRLLAILIVSHDMSGLLKTWKSKCWFIAGSLLLSQLFTGQGHPSTYCFVLSLDLSNFSSDCQSILY